MTVIGRTAAAAAAVLVTTLVLGALALALIDWNAARPWIAAQVKERTGRDLAIAGGKYARFP